MKVFLLALGFLAASFGNPAADSKVWIWKPLMPKLRSNINVGDRIGAPPVPLIVNGDEATAHSYPWQAALFIDDYYFCGGTLISDQWVLTAAHCTVVASYIEVVLGAQNLTKNESTQVTLLSSKIITHEDYNPFYLFNDVGLVLLDSPIKFTDAIQPGLLPKYSDPDLGRGVMLTATGWGVTMDDDSSLHVSETLNEVTDPSIANNRCEKFYGAVVTPATLCTSTARGDKGTCDGDSGSPLNYVIENETYIRGVASFVSNAGCTSGEPNGFTRTSHYLGWIEVNTGIQFAT